VATYEVGVGRLPVPPAPLLGGGIILYAEMLALGKYRSVEIELDFDESERLSDPAVAPSIGALSALERVRKVSVVGGQSLGAGSDRDFRDRVEKGYYIVPGASFDSPTSLLDLDDVNLLKLVRFKSEVMERASMVLDAGKRPVLCVHANSVRRPSAQQVARSIGDEDEWLGGLRNAIDQGFNMSILFIGNDAGRLAEKLGRPERVVPHVEDFPTQLACVHLSDAFLGMSSGPSTVAMFSTTPYIVFKHASHHSSQMEALLREDKYPFSLSSQRVLRIYPNRRTVEEACFSLAGHIT
jgi:hypothetical protein